MVRANPEQRSPEPAALCHLVHVAINICRVCWITSVFACPLPTNNWASPEHVKYKLVWILVITLLYVKNFSSRPDYLQLPHPKPFNHDLLLTQTVSLLACLLTGRPESNVISWCWWVPTNAKSTESVNKHFKYFTAIWHHCQIQVHALVFYKDNGLWQVGNKQKNHSFTTKSMRMVL